jgi:hypothetical protein
MESMHVAQHYERDYLWENKDSKHLSASEASAPCE